MGKRKTDNISPIEKAVNSKTKKTKKNAKVNNNKGKTENSQDTDSQKSTDTVNSEQFATPLNMSTASATQLGPDPQTYEMPQTLQYSPYSPYLPGHPPSPQNIVQASDNGHVLQTLLQKMENIERSVGQISEIRISVNKITDRLDSMGKRLDEIEHSQQFVSEQYESVSTIITDNTREIKTLQSQIKSLSSENDNLKKMNTSISDDLTDLKCRSMRDNLIFFGIAEGTGTGIRESDYIPSGNNMPENQPEDQQSDQHLVTEMSEGSSAESSGGSSGNPSAGQRGQNVENCEAKVHTFIRSVLKITNSSTKVRIDRAHRIGRFNPNKTRPIVVKFMDTASKTCVKDALRQVKLRDTPYNVTDQYPPEVQQKRRELIPVMIKARDNGKRATLIRDKIFY